MKGRGSLNSGTIGATEDASARRVITGQSPACIGGRGTYVPWCEVNRRLVMIGALVAALAAGGAVAGVVLAAGGGHGKAAVQPQQKPQAGQLDLHPIAGNFKPDKTKL